MANTPAPLRDAKQLRQENKRLRADVRQVFEVLDEAVLLTSFFAPSAAKRMRRKRDRLYDRFRAKAASSEDGAPGIPDELLEETSR